MDTSLVAIGTYPLAGQPGQRLDAAHVGPTGIVGSRAKRHALLVVAACDAQSLDSRGEPVRANLVLGCAPDELVEGARVHVGGAVVRLGPRPTGCPGRYAQVLTPGPVRVGDQVRVATAAKPRLA